MSSHAAGLGRVCTGPGGWHKQNAAGMRNACYGFIANIKRTRLTELMPVATCVNLFFPFDYPVLLLALQATM